MSVRARRRALGRAWAALVAVCAGFAAACAPPVEVPAIEATAVPVEARLLVAGDDAATPLMRHLSDHFTARHPGPAVVVEAPLGAAGALRALVDGALDAALVVTPAGQPPALPPGTVAQVVALSEAVLVTGAASGIRRMDASELLALLRGGETGAPRRLSSVLLAPADEPAQSLVARRVPGLAEAFDGAIERRRWPVFFEGQARRDALRRTPGALAAADLGALRLLGVPFWRVELSGVPADAPSTRLAVQLVTRVSPTPRVAALLAFLGGPEGRALVVDVGYGAP